MKKMIFLLIAIFWLVMPKFVIAAAYDTKSVKTSADAFANEVYPDKNYKSVGSITISNKFTNRFAYLKFPSLGIPSEAIIDKAIFKFYVHEQNYSDNIKLNLGPIKDDWNEGDLCWNNKPAVYNNESVEGTINIADDGWKEIDITSVYNFWQDNENKGLFVYPYGYLYGVPENEFAFSFRSKEAVNFGQPDDPAELIVEYFVPPSQSPSAEPSPSGGTVLSSPSPIVEASIEPDFFGETNEDDDEKTDKKTEEDEEASPSSPPKGKKKTIANYLWVFPAGLGLILILIAIVYFWLKKRGNKKKEKKKLKKKKK